VIDGQRIRIKRRGQPGRGGAPDGDLYVLVHVTPDRLFGRSESNTDNLTLTVPVTYPELVLGATLTVPTLDGPVSVKIPAGTTSGRTFRMRGRGVRKASGTNGDLLVTVQVVRGAQGVGRGSGLALRAYADATRSLAPRAGLY
jgi:molecular chaperone DnaJ